MLTSQQQHIPEISISAPSPTPQNSDSPNIQSSSHHHQTEPHSHHPHNMHNSNNTVETNVSNNKQHVKPIKTEPAICIGDEEGMPSAMTQQHTGQQASEKLHLEMSSATTIPEQQDDFSPIASPVKDAHYQQQLASFSSSTDASNDDTATTTDNDSEVYTPIQPKECPFEDVIIVPTSSDAAVVNAATLKEEKIAKVEEDVAGGIMASSAAGQHETPSSHQISSSAAAAISASKQVRVIPNSLVKNYMQLWKTRLSLLVVFTAMGSYCCTREQPSHHSQSQQSSSGRTGPSLLALCLGTFLQAGCANSLNEMMEVDRDRIMNRTMHRPLPTNSISMTHAGVQSVVVGALGTWMLGRYCDWNTAMLGFLNIGIYAGIYTPLKVRHWTNTWVGTLNGAIPPLMGSCAATGGDMFTPTGLFWFSLMSLWQIPHFMAISYKCRTEYQKAGYKMLPIEQPKKASNMAVWHSLALFPLCWSLPAIVSQVPWWFALASTPLNWYYALKPSLKFRKDLHRDPSSFESKKLADKTHYDNATHLFWCSLKHLPLLFSLSIVALNWDSVTEKSNSIFDRITGYIMNLTRGGGSEKQLQ